MISLKKMMTVAVAGLTVAVCACSDLSQDDSSNNGNGKEDGMGACPELVSINAAPGSQRRCYDQDTGQFVATECCREICRGAAWREQLNGTHCVWYMGPGMEGFEVGQFAPRMCCELNDLVEGECHASIRTRLRYCASDVYWEHEDDPEVRAVTPLEALQRCTSDEYYTGKIQEETCARDPMLPFCSLSPDEFDRMVLKPCLDDLTPEYDCVFGLAYPDIFSPAARIAFVDEKTITLESAADLGPLARQQLMEAIRVTAWEEISTLEEAFELVDFGEVYYHSLWEGSNGKAYEVYEYGAGDNSFGAFFELGKAEVAVTIEDSDLYHGDDNSKIGCGIPYGDRWNVCSSSDECTGELYCVGVIDHPLYGRIGKCVDFDLGTGSDVFECSPEQSCELDQGLVCAGDSRADGYGFCQPAWAIGTFEGPGRIDVPDGDPQGVAVPLYAWGLASVDEDVILDMHIEHEDFSQLKITMTNPTGLEGDIIRVFDGSNPQHLAELNPDGYGWAHLVKPLYTSGDEEVNGPWTLYLVDSTPGAEGRLYSWSLHLRSRLD